MMSSIRRAWRLSWIVTLPVAVVFVFWAMKTQSRYFDFHVRQETPDELTLLRSGHLEYEHMLESLAVERNALGVADRLAETGLRTISLFVREGNLQQLNADLPESGHVYTDGSLAVGGKPAQEVDVRYRGDSVYHWAYWKKSWRVKTKKDALFLGMRKFNLIASRTPNLLNNHLAFKLATHMGIISPYSEVVNVVLNGELLGVYILTEQLDESTIRRHGLMPGDLYSGDLAGQSRFKGHSNMVFEQPAAWTKVAVNNHFEEDSLDPLRGFLAKIQYADRPQGQAGLSEILDMDAMGRVGALDTFTQTSHTDNTHNWRFYYDPWKTQMVPVVWDPMGWTALRPRRETGTVRLDMMVSEFHTKLLRNGDFVKARQKAFEDFFNSGLDQVFLAETRALIERLTPAIEADPNLVYRGAQLSREYVLEETALLLPFIKRIFETARKSFIADPQGRASFARLTEDTIRVSVDGRIPVSTVELSFDRPLGGPLKVTIGYSDSSAERVVDVSSAASLSGSTLTLDIDLLARARVTGRARLVHTPATYDLRVQGGRAGSRLLDVHVCRTVGSPRVRVDEVAELNTAGLGQMYQVVVPQPIVERTVYSGEITISGNRTLDGDLLIEAGTHLQFEPGANLIVTGRVDAVGTKELPITFGPKSEAQEPWGVFAIKGSGADGSKFTHCQFREGSGWKQPLAEYSAMFSIHQVQRVLVEDCVFSDSRIVDDMVHGVYSEVRFHDCTFVRSLFDALDMDISDVEVLRCKFIDSGNDAVDLMTANATVDGCEFLGSGDKGISVGEDSLVLARGTYFKDCLIAVQTKDESTAVLINCELVGCSSGVDGLKKNWRYDGGGEAFIYKSHISGTDRPLHTDSHSRIVIRDSYVEGLGAVSGKRIDIGGAVDDESPRKAATRTKFVRHPDDVRAMGDLGTRNEVPVERKTRGRHTGRKRRRKRVSKL